MNSYFNDRDTQIEVGPGQYTPLEHCKNLKTSMKFKSQNLNQILILNDNPGPGTYDTSKDNKVRSRKQPCLLYKLPTINKKNLQRTKSIHRFYDNTLAMNSSGKYMVSKVKNVCVPKFIKSNQYNKINGKLKRHTWARSLHVSINFRYI